MENIFVKLGKSLDKSADIFGDFVELVNKKFKNKET